MRLSTLYHQSYDGGLNDTASSRRIDRDEASVLENWCIRYQGKLYRRNGLTQVGSTLTNAPAGLHAYFRSDGGKDLLVMDGDTLKYLNGTTFSPLDSGFVAGKPFWMETCPLNDKVYISNEDNTTHVWNRQATAGTIGSTTFTGGGLNDGTFGGNYSGGGQTYQVEIDSTGAPDTFRWSDDGGATWKATGVEITGTAQALSNGVTVTFGATTGHTNGDYWEASPTSMLSDLTSTHFNANVMKWHKNHLFFLNNLSYGGQTYPHRLGWSDIAAPETHDTSNAVTDIPGNGRLITAADLGDVLVLFKEHSIHYLSGWGETEWKITATASNVAGLSEQIGCVAPRGVTRVGNELWFVDDEAQIRRIYQTDFDAYRTDHISTKIQGTLAKINKAQLAKAVAWTSNDHVYFAFPQGSENENSLVVAFDILASKRNGGEEAWEVITGWEPSFMIDYLPSATPVLYLTDVTAKKVYSHTGDTDDGSAIPARWDSKDDDYDKPERFKRYKFGYAQASSTNSSVKVDIYASVDQAPYGKVGTIEMQANGSTLGPTGNATMGPTGTFILGGGGRAEAKFYYTAGGGSARGKTVRHSIRHNVKDQQPIIDNWSSHYKERPLR